MPTRRVVPGLDPFEDRPGELVAVVPVVLVEQLALEGGEEALGHFLGRVGTRPVTVLIYSEFGRRVTPNGSDGTDHGSAGTVLVAGSVRGGHHCEPPALDRLVDGDLATAIDFRAVYGGMLEVVLGVPAADVLGQAPSPLVLV